jgi:hypothetical protein
MTSETKTFGQQVAEKIVRVSIVIIGLLVLRGILSVMPMLRSAPVYVAVPGVSMLDPQNPLFVEQMRQGLVDPKVQAIISQLQLQTLEELQRTTQGPGASQLQIANEVLISAGLAIYPVTIAKAAVDTLIFATLSFFGLSLAALFRGEYARLPDLGQMMNLCILAAVVGIAYHSYRGLAYPLLFPDNEEVYGWVFVALALAPLVALGIVVARNMDAITAFVMRSGSRLAASPDVAARQCNSCGQPMTAVSKFCPQCGAASTETTSISSARKICRFCGADVSATARFCKECGKAG